MTDTAPLAVRSDAPVAEPRPAAAELTVEALVARQAKIQDAIRRSMKLGVHYGVIPGVKGRRRPDGGFDPAKPVLLKPGAELLCSLFQLCPVYVQEERTLDETIGYYRVRCELVAPSGAVIATAVGSANSRERRNWRWSGEGATRVFAPPDPFDVDNTLLKMAQKRALVAAALHATAASDSFTQDVEDEEAPRGEPRAQEPESPPVEHRREWQTRAEAAALGLELATTFYRPILHGRPDQTLGVQSVKQLEDAALRHGFGPTDVRACWKAVSVATSEDKDPSPTVPVTVGATQLWLAEIAKLHESRTASPPAGGA